MITQFHNHTDLSLLQRNDHFEVYRGVRRSDRLPVLIKKPLTGHAELALRNEHALLMQCRLAGLAEAIELGLLKKGPYLVLKDPGGILLKRYITDRRTKRDKAFILRFTEVALGMLDITARLHQKKIIHKNLNPFSFLIRPDTGDLTLTDLSLASIFPRENPQIRTPRVMEGHLAYISPEQTGRINRPLDYRTDFYSLGIVFYELLTGELPFEHVNPLELIHSHLARSPRPPHDINADIPRAISDLVVKMIAKTPEERYQSTAGVAADMKEIARMLTAGERRISFQLGRRDVPDSLCIGSKLYGRDEQISLLHGLFDRTSRGAMAFVTVAGYSGIGKTTLVKETYRAITEKRGYFISGKFDRFHKNIPYSAITRAIQGLIQQLLTEPQTRLDGWRDALIAALGENAGIVTDVIPDLELIIGPQPPVKPLGPLESQNRFNRVFKQFLSVFSRPEHPLVLFLDDLQWVDMATLQLLEFLVSHDPIAHLFAIGAYRNNEVGAAHPLRAFLDSARMAGVDMHHILLKPLKRDDVATMLAELLSGTVAAVDGLSRIVMAKTYGNPFFIHQFLTALYRDGHIRFDPEAMRWVWDAQAIQAVSIAENVVDLLIRRMQGLPVKTEAVLKVAACLGNQFDPALLATVTGSRPQGVFDHLLPALKEGLLVPVSPSGAVPMGDWNHSQYEAGYRFLHDRVHQAAYALTSTTEKQTLHLGIGRVLLEILDGAAREERIFDILDHLNFAANAIEDPKERREVAALNLVAGRKALAASAFEPAYTYLKAGIGFLHGDSWQRAYRLTLDLYTECHKAAHLCGRYDEMTQLFEQIRTNGRTPLDQAAAYKSRFLALAAQNLLPQSIDCALEILSELGEPVAKNLSDEAIRQDFMQTVARLSQFSEAELIDWPQMTDPVKLAVTDILDAIIAPTFIGLPELSPLVASKLLQLTITHGHTPESPFSYTVLGGMLCKIGPDIETGYRFGQLARTLADRFGSPDQKTKVLHSVTGYVNHWKQHLADTLADAVRGYQIGLESGDFEFAGYNTYIHSKHSLYCGRPLIQVEREMTAYSEAVRQLKQEIPLGFNDIFRQTAQNLLGRCDDPTRLIGDAYDERLMLEKHRLANDRLGLFYYNVCRLMLCVFFEAYEAAVGCAEAADLEIARISAAPADHPIGVFFGALAHMLLVRDGTPQERRQAATLVTERLSLLQTWAGHAPMNYLHKYHLLAAQRCHLLEEHAQAIDHFDKALASARASRYVNDEALCLELTGHHFLRLGHRETAMDHLTRARACYLRWGAEAKVRHLDKTFPELLQRLHMETTSAAIHAAEATPASPPVSSGQLDKATLVKASQAIAGELDLDRLLVTLIRVAIENAGADTGVLLLASEGQMLCAVRGTADGTQTLLKPFVPLSEEDTLSKAVINFVARARKHLRLSDPAEQPIYRNDTHMQRARPRSVLCIPIVHQTCLVGILYLENTRVPDAFPSERLEVIDLLASRIASAIENARLYSNLKNAEEKYRSIFENAVEGIFQSTPDGQFISANPSMARILGYESPTEMIANVKDIGRELYLHQEERDQLILLLRKQSLVTGFETRFRRKNGQDLWVAINARAVYHDDGTLAFMEGFVTDIAERKAAMEALQAREESLRKENLRLKSDIRDRYRFGAIVGKCPAMQAVYELIIKAAVSDAPVIVYGESGTGKELVARAVHDLSDRKQRPFVPVNCGALPENLLESEFFGYKKGAFTGANTDRDGYLDQARGGTLFLDELGEIGLNLQVKLLRVLDGMGFIPVGGREVKKTDLRIIAATNRNLRELVRKGAMREDFFYRVHVIPIHLPPLRERREDIQLLVDHFVAQQGGAPLPPITGKMMEAMWHYHWPGNVRELINVLQRYFSLKQFDLLGVDSPVVDKTVDAAMALAEGQGNFEAAIAAFERELLQNALADHSWHREKTARSLGVPLRTFFRKLQKHGLIRQD